jgi:hypothetical protein
VRRSPASVSGDEVTCIPKVMPFVVFLLICCVVAFVLLIGFAFGLLARRKEW